MKCFYLLLYFLCFGGIVSAQDALAEQYPKPLRQLENSPDNRSLPELRTSHERRELRLRLKRARIIYEYSAIDNLEDEFDVDHAYKLNVRLKDTKQRVQFKHSVHWDSKRHPNSTCYFKTWRIYYNNDEITFSAKYPVQATASINPKAVRALPEAIPPYSFGFTKDASMKVTFLKRFYPADISGMKIGDKIVSVDGIAVTTAAALTKQLESYTDDDKVQFVIERNGKQYTFRTSPIQTVRTYHGDLEVSGYPAFYWVNELEETVMGVQERRMVIETFVFVEDQVFVFEHIYNANEDPELLDFDFRRYRKVMLLQLRNIVIE